MAEVRNVKKDELNVRIFDSRQSMGEAAAAQAAADAEKARLEREANPTTEDLLKSILCELQKKA